jgi:D-alanyl-D-alanine carboxypeptidase/D-alanyl-D-alanine-endopeptidase (penicillin-binding protein 4)
MLITPNLRLLLSFCLLFICCLSLLDAQKTFSRKEQLQLTALVDESPVFQRGFTGFTLFDPETRTILHDYQGDKYFTPASNTKILTLFAAETILSGKLPVLRYQTRGDTLQFWGTGYPLLLHPDFIGFDTLHNWLAQHPSSHWIVSNGHFQDEHFGEGWSWDDYPYGYQLEKAALPIYGNRVQISKSAHLSPIKLQPAYFQQQLIYQPGPTLSRLEDRNIFTFGEKALKAESLDRQIAFRYSMPLLSELLRDTFQRQVAYNQDALPPDTLCQSLYTTMPDTLLQLFMQDSDNYLAEQLLLLCSYERYGTLHTQHLISYVNDTLLAYLPQPLDWVDGSGLSRYNQFTPIDITLVLDQLYQRIPQERLFRIFPTGGQSGTIANWYAAPNQEAFIFAKTGTLRHVHCLSGYLRSKTGKVYIFSFMHNNYPGKINELRTEMEKVLRWLYEHLG